MSIVLQNYVRLAQGSTPKLAPSASPEYKAFFGAKGLVFSDDASLRPLDLTILALSVVVMAGLFVFVKRTRLGKAMRATSQDRTMAGLVGIDVDRVIMVTFAIGSLLAAVAGVLMFLYTKQARFSMGFLPGMKAFTAAVLGGIGNIPGAMVGGFLLGLAEAAGVWFLTPDYKEVYALVVLLLVLVARPRGLLGERVAEKV
jgi:branched-chain amino acid transport system permease protein